jgi:hypothetical protein
MTNSLIPLAEKYGTDKLTHNYIEIYDKYFNKYRDDKINILEIGVFFGASILMWRDYFTNSVIYGMDTFKGNQGNGSTFENADKFYKEWENNDIQKDRIELYKCDQSNIEELKEFVKKIKELNIKFNIIIDDGSHKMYDQQVSFGLLFELLVDNGIYVIEDLHSSLEYQYMINDDSTLEILNNFNKTGEITSKYIDINKLSSEIKSVEVFYTRPNNYSITSVITKK